MESIPPFVSTQLRCEACGASRTDLQPLHEKTLFRCALCGHVVRDVSRLGNAVRTSAYGGWSALDRVKALMTARRVGRRLSRGRPLSVLEIGCGGGVLIRRLAVEGHRVEAIEPHPDPLPSGPDVTNAVTIHQARAEDVELPGGSFDVILLIHCIEHLADRGLVLRKCFAWLCGDGLIYLVTPDAGSSGSRCSGSDGGSGRDGTSIMHGRRTLHR